jgi:hypothetical protein
MHTKTWPGRTSGHTPENKLVPQLHLSHHEPSSFVELVDESDKRSEHDEAVDAGGIKE